MWQVADNLYVVVGHGRNHNSPVEWAARRPLPRLHLPIRHEVQRNLELAELQVEQHAERQLERLQEQLLELLVIQLREQLRIQAKVKLQIQVQTHVLVQVATRLKTLLPVLPGELLRVLLGVQ